METRQKFYKLKSLIEESGLKAREYFESDDFSNEQKADGSVVTRIDNEIEKIIRGFIGDNFPEDSIVGEEADDVRGVSGYVWHVDPIDGTDNFLRKIPFCAISVARLGDTTEGTFAFVHNPITNHTFSAFGSEGANENNQKAVCTPEPLGGRYVITIGRGREAWMKLARNRLITALDEKFGKATMYGSTALELAYVSAGRIDGFLTFGLASYDYAAGLYLVRAAGGEISVFEDNAWTIWEGTIKELCSQHRRTMFASHPDVHKSVCDFIGDPKRWAEGIG